MTKPLQSETDSEDSMLRMPEPSAINVLKIIPAPLLRVIQSTKLLGEMSAEWDQTDFSSAMMMLDMGMQANKIDPFQLSNRDLAISELLFWVQKTSQLNAAVFPHPKYRISNCLTEKINKVWAVAPELLAPNAQWTDDLNGQGFNLAEMMCMRGIVLDSDRLSDGAKEALSLGFSSNHSIELALNKSHFGVLDMISAIGPKAKAAVYAKFRAHGSLATLCSNIGTSLVVDSRYAVNSNGAPRAAFKNARIMNSKAARNLLSGMAASGLKSPQIGWASGCRSIPNNKAQDASCALACVTEGALTLANMGYTIGGFLDVARDVGTVVGYDLTAKGNKALAGEIAGTFSLELVRVCKNNWPSDFSGGASWAKHGENESFMDSVLNHFVESDIAVDEVVGILPKCLTECTLRYALTKALPDGFVENYEALGRAHTMAGIISNIGNAVTDISENLRRRRMLV